MRAVIGACGYLPMSVGIRQMNTPLDISISGRDIVVSYLRIRDNNPLARVRQREIVRSLEHKLKPLGSVVTDAQWCSMRVTVPSNSSARRVNAVLGSLLVQVTRIVQQPCTPKMVLELLRIESKERLRWTRDGRLRPVGRLPARNGNGAACRTYAAADILNLLRHPEIIAQWRHADAGEGPRRP
jgi:hypothetical protein